jgi:hypothetical protein
MKGIEMFSDLFLLFMLVIVIIIMTTLIWVLTEVRVAAYGVGTARPRDVNIRILFNPVRYDSALLTFLELRDPTYGISMKKLLNLVAIQNNSRVWVPEINGGSGGFVDVSVASKNILDEILNGKIYLLKIRDPEIIIAESGTSSTFQKTSIELFLLNGKTADLEFYVG